MFLVLFDTCLIYGAEKFSLRVVMVGNLSCEAGLSERKREKERVSFKARLRAGDLSEAVLILNVDSDDESWLNRESTLKKIRF